MASEFNTYISCLETPRFGFVEYGVAKGLPALIVKATPKKTGASVKISVLFEKVKNSLHNNIVFAGEKPTEQKNLAEILRLFDIGRMRAHVVCGLDEHILEILGFKNIDFHITAVVPSTGDVSTNDFSPLRFLQFKDTLVFPIASKVDYDYMLSILKVYPAKCTIELKPTEKFYEDFLDIFLGDKEFFALFRESDRVRVIV